MSVTRQHYIPRLLLNGFASRISGETTFVWYYRKGEAPREVSTRYIGVEKNFYGQPGKGSLDDTITKLENGFAKAFVKAKKGESLSKDDLDLLIQFVQNQIIRTRHLRVGMTGAIKKLSNMFTKNISSTETVSALFKNKEFRDHLRNSIKKELGVKDPKLIESAIRKLENNPNKLALLGRTFAMIYDQATSNLDVMVEEAQNNALGRIYSEESSKRIEEYRQLHWRFMYYDQNECILGDIGVIQFNIQSGEFHLPLAGAQSENILILPIAHNLLFVGSLDNAALPSLQAINKGISEHSMDFIVASRATDKENEYCCLIGKRAEYLDDHTLKIIEGEEFDI